jgi:hypothetical protein
MRPAPCRRILVTATFSTRCAIMNWCRTGSRIFGGKRPHGVQSHGPAAAALVPRAKRSQRRSRDRRDRAALRALTRRRNATAQEVSHRDAGVGPHKGFSLVPFHLSRAPRTCPHQSAALRRPSGICSVAIGAGRSGCSAETGADAGKVSFSAPPATRGRA